MISKTDLLRWLERRAFCEMTVRADDGPSITVGQQQPLGSSTAVVGITGAPAGYVSGTDENPDAGPNVAFAYNALKDPLYRYKEGGGALVDGGYPNQICGFQSGAFQTADLSPSAVSTTNIAALQAPVASTPLTLVAASGNGITLLSASFQVLNSQLTVPSGVLRIDANPAWVGFSQSAAIQIWSGAACGRAISLTSVSNLAGINFTIKGYDLYGYPQSEILAGPNNNTVNSVKGYKWIASITPSASNAGTVSVGTADTYQMPIRSDRFYQVEIYWNDTLITANTGFVAASALATADPRGTYALQGDTSNGVKRIQFIQRISPANLNNQPTGIFGVTPS